MIESSIVIAAATRSPGNRVAVARASLRNSTASAYSSREMSRPLSSTPFRYSSTATLTMFATRRAGDSCATRRFENPSPAKVRITAAARPSLSLKLIAEGIYRNSKPRCRPMSGKGLPLDDNHGHRGRFAVRERHESAGCAELFEALESRAVQPQLRRAVAARQHLDVPPSDAARELVAGKRLIGRLFGGQSDREVLRRLQLGRQILQLVRTKEPLQHPVALVGVHASDAVYVDGVDAKPDDHDRVAESSAASSASHARSAASKVSRSRAYDCRYACRSRGAPRAATPASSSRRSASCNGSARATSSASGARRGGAGAPNRVVAKPVSVSSNALAIAAGSNAATTSCGTVALAAIRRASTSGAKKRCCSTAPPPRRSRWRRRDPKARSARVTSGSAQQRASR